MQSTKLQSMAQAAILIAATIVLGYFFRIALPSGTGFVTLLDLGVYLAAFLLKHRWGAVVGGLSGLLLDLLSGYPQWAFFSLLAHGGQGYLAKPSLLGAVGSSFWMVFVYALGSALMYGPAAALPEIIPNAIQAVLGFVMARMLVGLIRRNHARR